MRSVCINPKHFNTPFHHIFLLERNGIVLYLTLFVPIQIGQNYTAVQAEKPFIKTQTYLSGYQMFLACSISSALITEVNKVCTFCGIQSYCLNQSKILNECRKTFMEIPKHVGFLIIGTNLFEMTFIEVLQIRKRQKPFNTSSTIASHWLKEDKSVKCLI